MKLLTKEILKNIPARYSGENVPLDQKMIHAKFFAPWGNWTWYACEYNPDEKVFFGYVVGFESEWGYFALEELEAIRGIGGLGIERDRYFKPCKFSELKEYANA
jgi:hypothetical protein